MSDTQGEVVERLEVNDLFKKVELRFDVQAFLRTPVGLYLVARGEAEREGVLEDLATADPEQPAAIRKLQQRIAVIDAWQAWLADAITEGQVAQQQLVSLERA